MTTRAKPDQWQSWWYCANYNPQTEYMVITDHKKFNNRALNLVAQVNDATLSSPHCACHGEPSFNPCMEQFLHNSSTFAFCEWHFWILPSNAFLIFSWLQS